jgi:hypothetical protein
LRGARVELSHGELVQQRHHANDSRHLQRRCGTDLQGQLNGQLARARVLTDRVEEDLRAVAEVDVRDGVGAATEQIDAFDTESDRVEAPDRRQLYGWVITALAAIRRGLRRDDLQDGLLAATLEARDPKRSALAGYDLKWEILLRRPFEAHRALARIVHETVAAPVVGAA